MDERFLGTLVELAKIGSAGVGIAIFLMVFIMLIREKPVDESTARLRETFLKYGVFFAVFCGVVALVPPLLQKGGGPLAMRLSFSPDFESQKLSPPKVVLPDGSRAEAEKFFSLRPSSEPQVLTVKMDATLAEVGALRETSKKLAESVGTAQQQLNTLASQVDSPAATQEHLEATTTEARTLQNRVSESLRVGNYGQANALSSQLRNNVIRTNDVVATIAQPNP
jgi:hypothetical protein